MLQQNFRDPASPVFMVLFRIEQKGDSLVTKTQIAALKYLVAKSPDSKGIGKRIAWFLIGASNQLTEDVLVTIREGEDGFTREEVLQATYEFHDMCSSNGSTHIQELMSLSGSRLNFGYNHGHLDPEKGFDASEFPSENGRAKLRYSFWLTDGEPQGLISRRITAEKLMEINLGHPGLYPQER